MPLITTIGALSARGLGFGAARLTSTWNPLDKSALITLSSGNLIATANDNGTAGVRGTTGKTSGQWHAELTVTGVAFSGSYIISIANASASLNSPLGSDNNSLSYGPTGAIKINGSTIGTGDAYVLGNVIAIELDAGAAQVFFQKVGGTGRKGPFSIAAITPAFFCALGTQITSEAGTINFGATPFAITPTAGYSAWG